MILRTPSALSGLGTTDLTIAIAQAIYQMEGSGPATLATRNNNPGNLRSGVGQTGTSGGFAVFPSMQAGWNALYNQIDLNISRGLTLQQFFAGGPGYAGYAPSSDSNDPTHYANFVAQQVGIDPNIPLNQLGGNAAASGGVDPITGDVLDTSDSGDSAGLFGLDSNTTVLVGVAAAGLGLIFLLR